MAARLGSLVEVVDAPSIDREALAGDFISAFPSQCVGLPATTAPDDRAQQLERCPGNDQRRVDRPDRLHAPGGLVELQPQWSTPRLLETGLAVADPEAQCCHDERLISVTGAPDRAEQI